MIQFNLNRKFIKNFIYFNFKKKSYFLNKLKFYLYQFKIFKSYQRQNIHFWQSLICCSKNVLVLISVYHSKYKNIFLKQKNINKSYIITTHIIFIQN